jgi:hypothetical protein
MPLSRREFVRRSAGTTAAVGSLMWSAPAIRSVQVGNAPGSEPPNSVSPTIARAGDPEPVPTTLGPQGQPATPTTRAPRTAAPAGAPDRTGSGSLPLTGVDAARLAAIGATAVISGRVLIQARSAAGLDTKYDRSR